MKPLFTDKCPFVSSPNIKEKIQWVRPKLVCEVEYAELTADDLGLQSRKAFSIEYLPISAKRWSATYCSVN
jgi:ATP-dependent DNA ligase